MTGAAFVVFLAIARVPEVVRLDKVVLNDHFAVQTLPLQLIGILLKHVLVGARVDIIVALVDARLGFRAVADDVVLQELLGHEQAAELALGAVGALNLVRLDVPHRVLVATEAAHGDFGAPRQMEVVICLGEFDAAEWALDCVGALRFVIEKLGHLVGLAAESAQLRADVPLWIEGRLVLVKWAWIVECFRGSWIRMHWIRAS